MLLAATAAVLAVCGLACSQDRASTAAIPNFGPEDLALVPGEETTVYDVVPLRKPPVTESVVSDATIGTDRFEFAANAASPFGSAALDDLVLDIDVGALNGELVHLRISTSGKSHVMLFRENRVLIPLSKEDKVVGALVRTEEFESLLIFQPDSTIRLAVVHEIADDEGWLVLHEHADLLAGSALDGADVCAMVGTIDPAEQRLTIEGAIDCADVEVVVSR